MNGLQIDAGGAWSRVGGADIPDLPYNVNKKLGVVLYVCNSVESGGRGFSGDPFTGQAAAYSRIFAYDLYGQRVLNFVTYYPHQLYSQLFTRNGELPQNKGVRMLRSQATLIVTCGGHLVDPQRWRIIS